MANEDLSIQWFQEKQSRAAVDHQEHERDEAGDFVFEDTLPDGSQKPKMKARKVKPAFWAMARITD
jgi:hypothetical protein